MRKIKARENVQNMKLEPWALKLLIESRLAHLATSTSHGKPHVVPVCYAYDGTSIYSAIDEKPKRASPNRLRRILNILENPQVSFLVDQYGEDWSELRYVIVRGSAGIVREGGEHREAVALLRKKYPQYSSMKLEGLPIIKIEPVSIVAWSASGT